MMRADARSYLPDDLLTKVDRASMAVGLEVRAPLLDHRIFEFAWRLPLSQKIRGRTGKWLLRELLDRYVPRELVDRPKMGFGIPIAEWLRGPLREWGEELLSPGRLSEGGLLDARRVRACWEDHQRGRRNRQWVLWSILMLQAWIERGASRRAAS
jgi:asparagine synthase (glutamine-hydrolysing)